MVEDHVYRTKITADVFLLAGLIATLIALGTISYQAVRAAMANPVDRLRAE